MEKTKTLLFMLPAVALFLFVACSGENDLTAETPTAQQKETPSNAIGFDAYLNRTTTRAGWPGVLELANLKTTGFGVFAYYGDGDLYSENLVPNFMYNQHVTYAISTDKWTYEPVKYWPNEYGSSAVSTGVDRVSFFAYAPYVAVEPSSGLLTSNYDNSPGTTGTLDETEKLTETGITWLSRNGKGGDPYVRYVTSFESAKCVDLCYGVAAADFTSSIDGGDGINNVKKGQPYLNVAKPTTDSRIKFDFKHALAKLRVQVDADVDVASHSGTDSYAADDRTRVWVRSITFEGVSQRGFLNMRTGAWHEVMDGKRISHATVTVYDGRRDGSEAISDDTYEEITGFNSQLIQDVAYTTTLGTTSAGAPTYSTFSITKSGVTYDYKDLFDGNLMVIPANEQLKVTIVYDVETADATLPNYLSDGKTKGSTIENKITKSITLGGSPLKLESGKAYTINLHLGLNSVKFEADVSGWDDATGGETDLPANVPAYEAGPSGSPGAANITLPASTTTYQFAVSGLTANEAVTVDGSPEAPISAAAVENNAAKSSGIAIVTLTIAANNTVNKNTSGTVTIKGSSSNKSVVVHLTQNPAPLGLSVAESAQKISGETDIVLSSIATVNWSTDVATPSTGDDSSIIVYKNGSRLTFNSSADPSTSTQFIWDSGDHKIVLGGAATAGDVFTITVKAGNADAETISFTVQKKDASINTFSYASGPTVGNTTAVPTLTFKDSGDNDITLAVTGDDGYNVTYTSSDNSIATVDSDGKVTGVAAGTVTITVTVSDTKNYHFTDNTKDFEITVTAVGP